jgi:hypothetical protein
VRFILDAGALVALDRNDRAMWRRMKATLLAEEPPITHAGIVGQAWRRGDPRQPMLANALAAIDTQPVDEPLGRAAGELLAVVRKDDVLDAAIVLLAADGDCILTSDVRDIETLANAAGREVEIVRV